MIGGLEGAFRCIQNPAHLFIWHLVIITQGEHNSLFFRKLLDGQLKFPLQLVGIEVLIRHDLIAQTGSDSSRVRADLRFCCSR